MIQIRGAEMCWDEMNYDREARCVQKGHWLERYWTDERQVAGWNGIGEAFWNVALSIVGREASPLLEQMLQLDSHGSHLCPLSQNCSPLSISRSWISYIYSQGKDIDKTRNGGSHRCHLRGRRSDQFGQVMNR